MAHCPARLRDRGVGEALRIGQGGYVSRGGTRAGECCVLNLSMSISGTALSATSSGWAGVGVVIGEATAPAGRGSG